MSFKFTRLVASDKWKDVRGCEALSLSCVKNIGVLIHVHEAMFWLTEDAGAMLEACSSEATGVLLDT
jgi:hypothetical protein